MIPDEEQFQAWEPTPNIDETMGLHLQFSTDHQCVYNLQQETHH